MPWVCMEGEGHGTVGWLQVAVGDALGVHVAHSREKLRDNSAEESGRVQGVRPSAVRL
jgi:hypothetical protein